MIIVVATAGTLEEALAEIVKRTVQRGGTILVPAFAVGWAQAVRYHLMHLKEANWIPNVPVFLDSPMAVDARRFSATMPEGIV